MTESTKVRLVRCPKCQNLLPELADYSVYQCGGCGAVLRANNKQRESDVLLEKSDEEMVTVVPTKSPSSSEKGTVILSDASDNDINSNACSSGHDEKSPEKNDMKLAEICRTQSKRRSDKWAIDSDLNVSTDEVNNKIRREKEDLNSQIGYNTSGPHGSGRMSDWQAAENVEMSRFPRTAEGLRFSASKYPDEGSSGQHSNSSYAYENLSRSVKDQDGVNRVQYLEHDRAELLKKLDELREQLTRSSVVADKPNEKAPLEARMGPQNPYGVSPFLGNRPDMFPYSEGLGIPMHGAYPSMHNSNQISGWDNFGSQMNRRVPKFFSNQQHPYYSGQYVDAHHGPYEPFRQNTSFHVHQPSCSCFNCYQRVSATGPPPAFHNNRFSDMPLYHSENPGVFGSHARNVRTSANVHGPQAHSRWPSDLNLENNGFSHNRPPRNLGGVRCRPVAGGAPFLTCHCCFELLKFPKNVKLMGKTQQRLRCGACSTVISFTVVDKKLVLSDDALSKHVDGVAKENPSLSHDRVIRFTANFSSDDYDTSGYDFQTLDSEAVQSSTSQGLNSGKPQEMQSFLSSSPSTSEDENSPDVLVASRNIPDTAQQPFKTRSPPPLDSPMQDNNNSVSRFGKGNQSSRSDQEKVIPNKVTTRQNSLKDTPLATEIDMSFIDSGISQDSSEANREESQPRTNKGGESFFANIIKKSFKDFSRSNQHEHHPTRSISINGHSIPERLIKKAEKQAGQIQPGQYWYDFRAGFWGVMGRPCMGIIPPFIEEFNYPIPQNCAAGNTSVFVNGRELHQKDLDLLAARGLPTEANRSYIIEINGRVLDEDTGEDLDSLGKLAPTVERMKHGFGMKVPKTIAA